jgi:hypothetical protein
VPERPPIDRSLLHLARLNQTPIYQSRNQLESSFHCVGIVNHRIDRCGGIFSNCGITEAVRGHKVLSSGCHNGRSLLSSLSQCPSQSRLVSGTDHVLTSTIITVTNISIASPGTSGRNADGLWPREFRAIRCARRGTSIESATAN